MKREVYSCDRCKAVVSGPGELTRMAQIQLPLVLHNIAVDHELCSSCKDSLAAWLAAGKHQQVAQTQAAQDIQSQGWGRQRFNPCPGAITGVGCRCLEGNHK